ncbi:MAG: flagellar basal body L-ring protein FlgH [Sphingomonadales bacterium]
MINFFTSPRNLLLVLMAGSLGACGSVDRIRNIGKAPDLSPIENAVAQKGYKPVALPMPAPHKDMHQANSLWRAGARAFFKDQRAAKVGDILTVFIDISDEASLDNKTSRKRTSSEKSDLSSFLGLESKLGNILPDAVDPSSLTSFGSTANSGGEGTVDRKEDIKLTIAAIVTQVLPNGNLVIQGRQEVRVNFEARDLTIVGVVRPEDITAGNSINHTQIAEARIAYGGRGQLTDVQQPRYGQQLFDIIFPF